MTGFCATPGQSGMAAELLANTDCHAFDLVERGYGALSQPGSGVSVALTGLLVIAVAIFGYRLLLGRGLLLSDAVGLAIKIGIVLAIASSWSTWQTVAYDSLARAPTRIAADLLTGINAGDPVVDLQNTLDRLEKASIGYRTRAGIASPLVGGAAASAMSLYLSGAILTLSILGLLVVTRILLAILLAIAPVMAGFILFDATRGMAAKWISAMVAAALAPMFVLVLASVELAIVGPLITRLLTQQAGNKFDDGGTTPIILVTLIFGIAIVMAVRSGGRIASGIRLPGRTVSIRGPEFVAAPSEALSRASTASAAPGVLLLTQSLERIARREGGRASAPARGGVAVPTSVTRTARGAAAREFIGSARAEGRSRVASASLPGRRSRSAARRDA